MTPEKMLRSLRRLKPLPGDVLVLDMDEDSPLSEARAAATLAALVAAMGLRGVGIYVSPRGTKLRVRRGTLARGA